MGWRVDLVGFDLLEENAGMLPGESLAVRQFRNCLWEMAPFVSEGAALC